jgi:hypothetical protein
MRGFPGHFGGVDFLIVDLDTALTFMDVADTTTIDETARRNHKNARKAYDTVLRLLRDLRPTRDQRKIIEDKLMLLRARLEAAGYQM